jgi:SAM-dependent methyltransferase
LLNPIDRLRQRGTAIPLPPAHLRIHYYGSWRPEAFVAACDSARAEIMSHGLRPDERLLDVGSGIGNLAMSLLDYSHAYDGFDVDREAVAWCAECITPRRPSFEFHFADVHNEAYNPGGRQQASSYRFPFGEATFDVIYVASVFTHMHPDDVQHYLCEISRVLTPAGRCIASAFLLNSETRKGIDAGASFISFAAAEKTDLYRLHDATRPEAAVAIDEGFVRNAYQTAGLTITAVRRGEWWSGKRHDQDVITATRR